MNTPFLNALKMFFKITVMIALITCIYSIVEIVKSGMINWGSYQPSNSVVKVSEIPSTTFHSSPIWICWDNWCEYETLEEENQIPAKGRIIVNKSHCAYSETKSEWVFICK